MPPTGKSAEADYVYVMEFEGDKIRRVEAIFIRSPYGLNSGWSTYPQTRSEKPQDVR